MGSCQADLGGFAVYTFLIDVWQTAVMMSPWLIIGAICVGVLHVILPPSFFERALSGRGGVIRAVLLGVPLPLCSCAVIPVAMGMHRSGAPKSSTVAFLVSTPQTGVDSILVTGGFLGWPFAIYRVLVALIMGVVGGLITPYVDAEADAPTARTRTAARRHTIRDGIDHAWMSIRSIWGWVLIGVLVSAGISQAGHVDVVGSLALGAVGGSLMALVIALPLYVCATASIPIAVALVDVGLPVEAAIVFLIAGPATNTATIGAVYATLGRNVTLFYLALTVFGSLVFAWLFAWALPDYVLPNLAEHHEHASQWDSVFGGLFVLASVGWALTTFRAQTQVVSGGGANGASVVSVEGMTCQGCVKRLQRALDEAPSTPDTQVSLPPGQVVWHGAIARSDVEAVIVDCGFLIGEGESE